MNIKRLLLAIVLLWGSVVITQAQTNNAVIQQQLKTELDKRGLKQADVEKRLREKGIDLDNVSPEDAPRLEPQIQAVLAELEAEKKRSGSNTKASNNTSIDDGRRESIDISAPAPFENANREVRSNVKTKTATREVTKDAAEGITQAIKEGEAVDVVVAEKLDNIKASIVLAPVWGMQIFRNKSIEEYRKIGTSQIKATDNYVLGEGDQLAVSIWGIAEYEGLLTINKEGYVQPDRMPRIYLKGQTYGKAKEILRARFGRYYPFKTESFSVAVNYSRTITVNIYGEVFTAGGFVMPATNTAFNALVAAGGPSDVGSVRMIKLLREGEPARTIDVYEFMVNPSVKDKLYLEDNDIISVPIANRVVTIQGSIRRPYRYELLPNENLMKLIEFAGGLADSAYNEILQVKRYVDDKQVLIDVKYRDLVSSKSDFTLLPGDIIMVNNIAKPYDNMVAIEGAVDFPKGYEYISGMRLSDLLRKGVLSKEARKDIAFFQRANPDGTVSYSKVNIDEVLNNPAGVSNIELRPKDKLLVYSLDKYADNYYIGVTGAVRLPQNRFPYDPSQSLKVEDAILLAGGLKPDATDFAYIMRSKPEDPHTKEYVRVNLKNLFTNRQSSDNIILKPSDKLVIPSRGQYIDSFSVNISGLVRNPGRFQYDESLTLKDVLTLSGGLKLGAATNRVEISRIVINNNEPTNSIVATLSVDENLNPVGSADYKLQPFDEVMVRSVPEFDLQKTITLNGQVRYPGVYTITTKNETLKSVIERAGGLTVEAFTKGAQLLRQEESLGFLVMDLEQALKSNNSKFNYIIKGGDVITVPKIKDFVTIQGATRANYIYSSGADDLDKISVPFHGGKRASYYVNEYGGGFAKNAKRKDVTVVHANGRVKGTTDLRLFKIYPKASKGATIRVTYKEATDNNSKEDKPKEKVNWEKVFQNTITAATSIFTLLLISQQVTK